jgi:4-amino-4-deoxy-L-arabinose transferase-like glycosyltransferase
MRRGGILFIIFLLAAFLRFYQVGENPPSLYWDEASISYNAYSIFKTGADEYGTKLPLSFRSFEDYKPPLYIYLTVPSIALFGWNEFAIRFPSAFFGTLTVVLAYFLLKELFKTNNQKVTILNTQIDIPLIGTFLFAISPWHLQFSRPAFEANVGLFFLLLGIFLFLKGSKNYLAFLVGAVAFVLSMYAYHSFRVVTPLVILTLTVLFLKYELKSKKDIVRGIIFYAVLFILLLPVGLSVLVGGDASSRLSQVTLFNVPDLLNRSIRFMEYDLARGDLFGSLIHNRRIVYFFEIIKGYLDHFNPNYLFMTGDSGRHHHAVEMGMLYLWEIGTIFIGGYQLLKRADRKIIFLLLLLLISPLPSAVTTGTPHAVRSILMLFPLIAISAYGVVCLVRYILNWTGYIKKIITLCTIAVIFLLNFYYYLHQYYVHTPIEYGDFWQYGYKELYKKLHKYEDHFDSIIVTYEYDHPDTYYLLYNKIEPEFYHRLQRQDKIHYGRFESKIGKYHFKQIDWASDTSKPNTLIVAAPSDMPNGGKNIVEEIKFLNGDTAFLIIAPSDTSDERGEKLND